MQKTKLRNAQIRELQLKHDSLLGGEFEHSESDARVGENFSTGERKAVWNGTKPQSGKIQLESVEVQDKLEHSDDDGEIHPKIPTLNGRTITPHEPKTRSTQHLPEGETA